VADASGAGAGAGFKLAEPPIKELLEEGFTRALSGKSMLSQPLMSVSLKEPVLVLSQPVKAGGGNVQGAVLAVAGLGPLWSMTKEKGEKGQIDVYVVDGRGRLVAHSDPAKLDEGQDFSQVEIVKQP
jgi:hypothetical protein